MFGKRFRSNSQGTGKAKKRSAYVDDGWHCDRCLGTQTSLRRNGPNGQRMCTACYSKMQREKKKGEVGYCERLPAQEPEADSQLSVRGARPASAAARKFIEEFARNKGAWDTSRPDGGARRDSEMEEPVNTQTAAYGAALLLGAPRGMSEGLFTKAPFGVSLSGAQLLQRDPILASSRTMRYMTDHTYYTGNGEEMRRSRNLSPDGPFPQAAPWPDSSLNGKVRQLDNEDPSVLQGASNLMLLTQQSSPPENISDAKHCTPINNAPGNLAVSRAPQLTVGELRMALTVGGIDEPGRIFAMAPCPMDLCTDHLPAAGLPALPERPFVLQQIPKFHTHSAPTTLSAPGAYRGSGQLLGEGSIASSRMAGATLQGRQQSDPCILPFHHLKN